MFHPVGEARRVDGARDGARGIALKPYLLSRADDSDNEEAAGSRALLPRPW
jgi:hypothetical protein